MSQPLVLAIEPDLRQAAIVKRIVREKALADVVVVDSLEAAIETMRTTMPDVLLLSALLSPRDEDELVTHLKTLDHAGHLQTHTIPQLASTLNGGEERASKGLLSAFRRKKEASTVAGCDPDMFAEEIRAYLERAADKRHQLQQMPAVATPKPSYNPASHAHAAASESEDAAAGAPAPDSAWASPFEWKPANATKRSSRAREEKPAPVVHHAPVEEPAPVVRAEPVVAEPEPILQPEPVAAAPVIEQPLIRPAEPEPIVAAPVAAMPVDPPRFAPPPLSEPVRVADPAVIEPPAGALITEKVGKLVDPAPRKSKADGSRLKPVADRPARLTSNQLRDLIRKQATSDSDVSDRLGSLTRWARSEAPQGSLIAPVANDARALISSLAVPSAIASVSYPSGVRIRRVRVPVLPDHEAARQASA